MPTIKEETMSLVRVGPRGQITIPNSLRRETRISAGSILEAEVRRNFIILTPVKVVNLVSNEELEAAIAEGLKDYRAGRVSGPFKNMTEFKEARRQRKKQRV